MVYFSRSRKTLWRKGETSGNVQYLKELSFDCDNDTLLAKVEQVGSACHTMNRSCFYRNILSLEQVDKNIFDNLFSLIKERKNSLEKGTNIKVVDDQWRTPTLAEDLAKGCYLLVENKSYSGYFHLIR